MTETIDCTLTPDLCVVADPPLRTEGKNALYNTCRKLADLGLGDAHLQAHDERGGKTLRVGPIGVAAKWTIRENVDRGPELKRWMPFSYVHGQSPDAVGARDGGEVMPEPETARAGEAA